MSLTVGQMIKISRRAKARQSAKVGLLLEEVFPKTSSWGRAAFGAALGIAPAAAYAGARSAGYTNEDMVEGFKGLMPKGETKEELRAGRKINPKNRPNKKTTVPASTSGKTVTKTDPPKRKKRRRRPRPAKGRRLSKTVRLKRLR